MVAIPLFHKYGELLKNLEKPLRNNRVHFSNMGLQSATSSPILRGDFTKTVKTFYFVETCLGGCYHYWIQIKNGFNVVLNEHF